MARRAAAAALPLSAPDDEVIRGPLPREPVEPIRRVLPEREVDGAVGEEHEREGQRPQQEKTGELPRAAAQRAAREQTEAHKVEQRVREKKMAMFTQSGVLPNIPPSE